MTTWAWIIVAAVTAYLTKFAGYLLPRKLLNNKAVPGIAAALTVGLLASLVITNALASGQALQLDSRLLALAAALIAAKLRAPFIVIVIVGAVVTALGRMAGLP
ncbi:MAG: AzlD domain-containing protein [Propionibacteriaceae bacterium]|jgi:uncharacterized membrane protein|nr:AzlD domain-containing protein [Propionibacteriaceae bacterium]